MLIIYILPVLILNFLTVQPRIIIEGSVAGTSNPHQGGRDVLLTNNSLKIDSYEINICKALVGRRGSIGDARSILASYSRPCARGLIRGN